MSTFTVWTLMYDHDSLGAAQVLIAPSEEAANAALREAAVELLGEEAVAERDNDDEDGELIRWLTGERGWLIYFDAHTITPNLIAVRDPDGGTDVRLYVDGVRVEGVDVEEVDAGRGYSAFDWRRRIADAEGQPESDYRTDLLAALNDPPGSSYIEGWGRFVKDGCALCGHTVDEHDGTGPCPHDDCQGFTDKEEGK